MQPYRKFTNASSGGVPGLSNAAGGTAIADNLVIRGDGGTGIQGSLASLDDNGRIQTGNGANGGVNFGGAGARISDSNNDGRLDLIAGGSSRADLVDIGGSAYRFRVTGTGGLSAGNVILSSSTVAINGDTGINRVDAGVLGATTGGSTLGFLQTAGFKRKTADQTVTDSTTLVNDTHLTVSLAAGRSYGFKFTLYVTTVATSGIQVALGGTATHTDLISDIRIYDHSVTADSTSVLTDSTTVGNHTAGSTGAGPVTVNISGTTTINAAGTFLVQFAQTAETGAAETVTLLRGSTLEVWDIA